MRKNFCKGREKQLNLTGFEILSGLIRFLFGSTTDLLKHFIKYPFHLPVHTPEFIGSPFFKRFINLGVKAEHKNLFICHT
jgi:hypothetical protein